MKVKFICPECQSNTLEEVMSDVFGYATITDIDNDKTLNDAYLDYGIVTHEGGSVNYYACAHCNFEPPVSSPQELYNWLKENNMLEK